MGTVALCNVEYHCKRLQKEENPCASCMYALPHIKLNECNKKKVCQKLALCQQINSDINPCETCKENKTKKSKEYKLNKTKVRDKVFAIFGTKQARRFCAFYSISFPMGLSDEDAHKLLNIWLTRCRKVYKMPLYLWVAERQGNGTLHFHLLTTTFMNIRIVNHFMKAELKTIQKKGCEALQIGVDLDKYNGVDVERVYSKSRKLAKYMSKYVSKNDEKFTHLCWHCSRSVSLLFTHEVSGRVTEYLEYLKRLNVDVSIYENEYVINIYFEKNMNNQIMQKIDSINDVLLNLYSS